MAKSTISFYLMLCMHMYTCPIPSPPPHTHTQRHTHTTNISFGKTGLLAAIAWPATLLAAASIIDNPWSVCTHRAVNVGQQLADVLLSRQQVLANDELFIDYDWN